MHSDLQETREKDSRVQTTTFNIIPSLTLWNRFLKSGDVLALLKFTILLGIAVIVCAIGFLSPNDILRSRQQFKSWYPQYKYQFDIIARDNCSDAYSVYLYGTRQNTSSSTLSGAGGYTLFTEPIVNCILNYSSQYIQYQLNTSQVILGLTPTIIALLGASSEEVCCLALIGRRRLLGLLLSAASPSIYTERAFKFQDPDKILKDLDDNHVKSTVITKPRWFFVALEYIAVLCSIANIAALNWELGTKSINSINTNTVLMPMLWSILAIVAHLAGAVVFNMRARGLDSGNNPMPCSNLHSYLKVLKKHIQNPCSTICNIPTACKRMARREVCWRSESFEEKRYFVLVPETRWFTFLAWLLSVMIIFHIIIGTLILSSTNFVGPKDALGIMVRYIASVIVCRIVLVYELVVLGVEYKDFREVSF